MHKPTECRRFLSSKTTCVDRPACTVPVGHQGPQTPSKSFQMENAGGCRICARSAAVGALAEPNEVIVRAASVMGAVFGILGALLLAMPALPGFGFGAFLVSNVAWLIVSRLQRQNALHIQQWVFLCCSLLGLWNWWLGPLMLGR